MLLVGYDCRDSNLEFTGDVCQDAGVVSVSFQRLLSPDLFPKAGSEVGPWEKYPGTERGRNRLSVGS